MKIKGIVDEDFVNYKLPSMFIATSTCGWKCTDEHGKCLCQNLPLAKQPTIDVKTEDVVARYISNPITKAVVFGGLEPLDQTFDVFEFIEMLRMSGRDDDVVIYTGYTSDEKRRALEILVENIHLNNIVVKWGRYRRGDDPHFDPVLGVNLASDNQYAERLS